jgi:hypothetical protein
MAQLGIVFLLCVTLISCASIGTHGMCLAESDAQHWRRLSAAPHNAAMYRALADANSSFNFEARRELWFKTSDGEVTLCRLSENTSPSNANAGEWWQFDASGALISGRGNGWVTVH